MRLVLLFEAAQDRDRVLEARLLDHDRSEAPFERRVLLDVFAILVEGRRANQVQLAAREHRLEQVARVHRTFGLARADDRVQLVDEEDDLPLGGGDVFEHGFEALFEFAAVLRAGDERAHVERNDALVLQAFRDVAAHDALCQAFDDRRLAHAGIADEHRIVLRAAREHLDDAPDLFVASDDGIEFSALGLEREVAAVTLERLVRALRILRSDALVSADVAQRLQQLVLRHTVVAQQFADRGGRLRHRQQHVLDRGVIVLQRFRLVLRDAHDASELGRERHLRALGAAAAQSRKPSDRVVDLARDGLRVGPGRSEDVGRDAAFLLEQRREHMLGRRLRVVLVQRTGIGGVQRVADALGHLLDVHGPTIITRLYSVETASKSLR